MTRQNWIVIVVGFIQVGLFIVTAFRIVKSRISAKQLAAFLSIVVILALVRTAILLYLQYRTQSHTFSENVLLLSYALYPELPLTQMLPTTTYAAYLTVSISTLILGSFLWAFPLLIVLSSKSKATVG
jgi:hypothetical protein